MVVKPLDFVARGARGLIQPAVKCRGPRVPADHLRPRVRRAGKPRAPAQPRARRQALAGAARVRAGHRRAGAVRPPRAAAPRARVRLRRAGAGERAGGPEALTLPAGPALDELAVSHPEDHDRRQLDGLAGRRLAEERAAAGAAHRPADRHPVVLGDAGRGSRSGCRDARRPCWPPRTRRPPRPRAGRAADRGRGSPRRPRRACPPGPRPGSPARTPGGRGPCSRRRPSAEQYVVLRAASSLQVVLLNG